MPNENGGFDVIAFPASCGKGTVNNDHILSTKTNGYNDFLGSSDDGIILVNFDGNSTYFKAEVLSEDYTWEYLDNDLVKIICYDNRNKNEIAAAKFLYDNGYTEHILLYSSLPDGTPSVSVPQTVQVNYLSFMLSELIKHRKGGTIGRQVRSRSTLFRQMIAINIILNCTY